MCVFRCAPANSSTLSWPTLSKSPCFRRSVASVKRRGSAGSGGWGYRIHPLNVKWPKQDMNWTVGWLNLQCQLIQDISRGTFDWQCLGPKSKDSNFWDIYIKYQLVRGFIIKNLRRELQRLPTFIHDLCHPLRYMYILYIYIYVCM